MHPLENRIEPILDLKRNLTIDRVYHFFRAIRASLRALSCHFTSFCMFHKCVCNPDRNRNVDTKRNELWKRRVVFDCFISCSSRSDVEFVTHVFSRKPDPQYTSKCQTITSHPRPSKPQQFPSVFGASIAWQRQRGSCWEIC